MLLSTRTDVYNLTAQESLHIVDHEVMSMSHGFYQFYSFITFTVIRRTGAEIPAEKTVPMVGY